MPAGMFDDEADTISVDPDGYDTTPVAAITEPVETPIERKTDTLREVSPFAQTHDIEFDETDVVVVSKLIEDASATHVSVGRPGTNADWPPAPKKPASRQRRRAGMYKAISSITKVLKSS